MTERLVVCLRYAAIECEAQHYLGVARRVEAALAAVGGERISWGADRYAFEFDPDDFALVLRQLIAMQLEHPEHGVGLGCGELFGREDGLLWGRALVVASALAGGAKPGELLLDPHFPDVRESRLATLGRIPVRVGERYASAALLLPGACPPTGYRSVEEANELARRVRNTSLPPPSMASRPSVFDALRSGNPDVMFDLARTLRSEQPDNQAATRLEAMALLAQGKADEGLEQLERQVDAVGEASPLVRAQATLALAVGYARVGEGRQAALTALHALRDARQSGDRRAEQACAQLLAQLAAKDGATDAARAWQQRSSSVG
jgi:hypothetical protein